ncbi:hypothetical protein FJY93_04600 [Candidatus Kaiserbacteria bacterium]|nr:hypothetical protein [Candidatus Kaiserbacteria bacterium]
MQRDELKKYDLPDAPGVYIFLSAPERIRGGRDARRKILYVGKATSLRDRVRSYFGSRLIESRGERIVAMIERATKLDWQETGSVLEALILEAALIKKHQPPYNVDEKDDKSWNYVVITKEDFPRVLLVRGRLLTKNRKATPFEISHIFGPFPHGGQLKEALKIVRKIFPYRDTCTPCPEMSKVRLLTSSSFVKSLTFDRLTFEKKSRVCKPCFNRQLGLCPGVCSGEMSKAEYATSVKHIAQLFSGNMKGLRRMLAREMKVASVSEQFEKASVIRRQIAALEHIRDVSLIKPEKNSSSVSGQGMSIRIEAYDIAHTAGTETGGVMTVVQDGEPVRAAYRKFIIRTVTNNDVAALRETLSRRLAHAEWPLPRVFTIDGGAAQVRAAQSVLKEAGIEIPIVGVVKNEAHKPERLIGDAKAARMYEREILLANAEAHRYAIGWHRTRLRKRSI